MYFQSSLLIALAASGFLSSALPTTRLPYIAREVTSLNAADVAQSQVRDNTATRAFTGVTITTGNGQCLSVDPLSGDFRENLTPVEVKACDGSANQQWDVLTSGVHNNVAGQALIVSSLTQACLNFDPRRAAGDQVILFSCGGRADGSGQVTTSQLFAFNGSAGPLELTPDSSPGTCLTTAGGATASDGTPRIDNAACQGGNSDQLFTFGGSGAVAAAGSATTTTAAAAAVVTTASTTTTTIAVVTTTSSTTATTAAAAAATTLATTTTTAQTTTTTTAAAVATKASSSSKSSSKSSDKKPPSHAISQKGNKKPIRRPLRKPAPKPKVESHETVEKEEEKKKCD